ncbi:hypothetical protein Tco_0937203 [Tanacetum coccineum]|uniref:Uncharacterized protein n=1 Tax=Tanacetum coccineum TaxID=301880 RepID=A0ABQ5DFK9_9ASTR
MVSVTIHQDTYVIPPMTSPVIDLVFVPDSPTMHQPLPTTTAATATTTIIMTTIPPPPQPQQVSPDFILINRLGELEQHIADLVDANQALEERLDKHRSRLYRLENQDIPNQVSKVVDEIVTDAVDWAMHAPLRERFRDLPEADMKEILHNRMWESKSYQTHEDHMTLTSGASGASGSSQSPPPPPPPSNTQGGQSTSTAAPSSSKTAASAEYTAWTMTDTRIKPSISPIPEELHMGDDSTADEQAYSSSGKDVGALIIIPRQRFYIDRHTSKGRRAVRTHMRILSVVRIEVFPMYGYNYMKKIVLRRADLKEYVIAERDFKYLYPSDFEDLYLLNLQGHLNHLSPEDKKILTTAVNLWTRNLVIRQRVEDFQLGIESYQTQLNLTKPRWDAKGFEYKHDFTVIDSLRAVTFRDKYGVQMIMRFNEIHKFSDGTLHQIDEALDYRVKEFRVNRRNPGLDTRFWTKKDVDRSKGYCFHTETKTRRIFQNLESFVGGRIREGDYRLLKRTE